jgi:hypothetical protein
MFGSLHIWTCVWFTAHRCVHSPFLGFGMITADSQPASLLIHPDPRRLHSPFAHLPQSFLLPSPTRDATPLAAAAAQVPRLRCPTPWKQEAPARCDAVSGAAAAAAPASRILTSHRVLRSPLSSPMTRRRGRRNRWRQRRMPRWTQWPPPSCSSIPKQDQCIPSTPRVSIILLHIWFVPPSCTTLTR